MAFGTVSPKFKTIKEAWEWWVSVRTGATCLGWKYTDAGEIYLTFILTP